MGFSQHLWFPPIILLIFIVCLGLLFLIAESAFRNTSSLDTAPYNGLITLNEGEQIVDNT
jgi:hypothetical protein